MTPGRLALALASLLFTAACVRAAASVPAPPGASGTYTVQTIGTSVEGRPIQAHRWNARADAGAMLVLGAVHGDERESGQLPQLLLARWRAQPQLLGGQQVILVPFVNPDGWAHNTRGNARGVDINRNFPAGWRKSAAGRWDYGGPEPLSEPETRAVHGLLEGDAIARVVALHSCRSCGGVNNFDGPGRALAVLMRRLNRYQVLDEWPAPTPGSFGTMAGKVRGIPTITLEMPRGAGSAAELERNALAIEAVVQAVTLTVPTPRGASN